VKYRKKPAVVEAITFEEMLEYGLAQDHVSIRTDDQGHNGIPLSFAYKGQYIAHETDDCYIIPTPEGNMNFRRGDMLITGVNGEIYPCKPDIFKKTYEPIK